MIAILHSSLRQPLYPIQLDGSFVSPGYPGFTISATYAARDASNNKRQTNHISVQHVRREIVFIYTRSCNIDLLANYFAT